MSTFSVGDSVMFINDAGIVRGPYTITAIETKDEVAIGFGRIYYLNWDCPWYATYGRNLSLVSDSLTYRVVNKESPMYGHKFQGTPSVACGESWIWDNGNSTAYRAANCEVVQ